MIEIKNLYAGYKDATILKGIDMKIDDGDIVALIGHNGAGKTTLFKSIMNILKPKKGSVVIEGSVAYVPQDTRVFGNLTVTENVLVASNHKTIPKDLTLLFPILEHKKHTHAKRLSGGERQMVALARALINKPDTLLLDEPTVGLSPKLVKEVFAMLININKELNTTMIIIEHNLTSLFTFANKAYILEKGEVKRVLTKDELKNGVQVYKEIMK